MVPQIGVRHSPGLSKKCRSLLCNYCIDWVQPTKRDDVALVVWLNPYVLSERSGSAGTWLGRASAGPQPLAHLQVEQNGPRPHGFADLQVVCEEGETRGALVVGREDLNVHGGDGAPVTQNGAGQQGLPMYYCTRIMAPLCKDAGLNSVNVSSQLRKRMTSHSLVEAVKFGDGKAQKLCVWRCEEVCMQVYLIYTSSYSVIVMDTLKDPGHSS